MYDSIFIVYKAGAARFVLHEKEIVFLRNTKKHIKKRLELKSAF